MPVSYSIALDNIRAYGQQLLEANEMVGLQMAFTDRQDLVGHLELGYANLAGRIRVDSGHRFEFGSIGKSFTAILCLQLDAEGKLDLHVPATQYAPWLEVESAYEPFSIHHLLSHTAGIVGGTDYTSDQRTETWSLRFTRTGSRPGTFFHYSNVGYKLIGQILEDVTGQSYAELIQSRILDPLGMTNSAPVITHDNRSALAVGYQERFDDRPRVSGHGVVPAPWLETDTADGCISASATDLAVYLRMLLNRGVYPGGRLLTEGQFARMTTPVTVEETRGYGYGLNVEPDCTAGLIGHTGGMVGYISSMRGDQRSGFGAVVFTNSMNSTAEISKYALETLTAAANEQTIPEVPSTAAADTRHFLGTWYRSGASIEVGASGDQLVLKRGPESRTLTGTPYRDGTYVSDQAPDDLLPWRFINDEAGVPARLIHGSEEYGREITYSSRPHNAALDRYAGHYRSYNPWTPSFRVIVRGDTLLHVGPHGEETTLVPDGDGFRLGVDEHIPERLTFGEEIAGVVRCVRDSLQSHWYRSFTP